ncbi:serine hydrolase [Candidatus Acetothermia bacterium]|nr:serine hydrolase [Candidatus Acetothermia bacterium]
MKYANAIDPKEAAIVHTLKNLREQSQILKTRKKTVLTDPKEGSPMNYRLFRNFVALVLFLPILVTVFGAHALAQEKRSLAAQTGWWWYYNVSPDFVGTKLNDNQARLIDIKVTQASPLLFSVVMVKNTGAYQKAWGWYYGVDAGFLASQMTVLQSRLIDLETYVVNGQQKFAAVFVSNTGAQNKGWWWYFNTSPDFIAKKIKDNKARLIDLDSYEIDGNRLYSAVMISNKGADKKAWWWYYNASPDFIANKLTKNKALLTSIDRGEGDTFTVIMEKSSGQAAWWNYGKSAGELYNNALQNGARLVDVEPYDDLYAGLMVTDVSAETTRVNELMRSAVGNTGYWGVYLKQLDGPVLGAINERRPFEPASMMKALYHLKVIKQFEENLNILNTQQQPFSLSANVDDDPTTPGDERGSGCPTYQQIAVDTLANVLAKMMKNSDNRATDAILLSFGGKTGMQNFAHSIGMNDTEINHHIGCPKGDGESPNQLTLHDAGILYEGAADGTLLKPTSFAVFQQLMPNSVLGRISGIVKGRVTQFKNGVMTAEPVTGEAKKLGLTDAQADAFINAIQMAWKPGQYTVCGCNCNDVTIGGWASLPFKSGGQIVPKQYVFGVFTNDVATVAAGGLARDRGLEIFRQEIIAALKTWKAAGASSELSKTSANTGFSFKLVAEGTNAKELSMAVFDASGRAVFQTDWVANGFVWHGQDTQGQLLANGVYLYVIAVRTPDGRVVRNEVKKLIIVR